ncbi:MAG: LPP20 family lipoprotein [Bacteriovoracaceae bacterium]|nr:LPP20 family lipoprotein [Bacteriovoracaceae bacterium]
MKKLSSLIILSAILATGCSSTKKEAMPEEREHENIKRDYEVRDASSNSRPGWVEDAEVWANGHGKDIKKFRFFSFETEPKVSRSISCNIAKANARADIAGEIATFIDKSLATTTEGNANIDENNPHIESLKQYVENTLAEKVQALIHGAAVVKTYWEKRKYLKKKGAKKDFTGWTCAVFLRMPNGRLQSAIEEAANFVVKKADPEIKAKVKKAMNDASNNFVKAKKGEI